jgi:hypothetical protein
VNGGSEFSGYKHHLKLKFTVLRLDGTWAPPQAIALTDPDVFPLGEGIVDDPLVEPESHKDKVRDAIQKLNTATAALMDRTALFVSQMPKGTTAEQFSNMLQPFRNAVDTNITELNAARAPASIPKFDTSVHTEPLDGYTLTGLPWDQVFPSSDYGPLWLIGRNFVMSASVDFYKRTITPNSGNSWMVLPPPTPALWPPALSARQDGARQDGARRLYTGVSWSRWLFHDYAHRAITSDQRHLDELLKSKESIGMGGVITFGLFSIPLATIDPAADLDIINGSPEDAILDTAGDLILLQKSVRPGFTYLVKRLGTTLGEKIVRQLFTGGINTLLDITTQRDLEEEDTPLTDIDINYISYAGKAGKLNDPARSTPARSAHTTARSSSTSPS